MKVLLGFIRRAVVVLGLLGAALAAAYFLAERTLPELDSQDQIISRIGEAVENARRGLVHGVRDTRPFEVTPDIGASPAAKALLAAEGCVTYLSAPPEAPFDFRRRLMEVWLGTAAEGGPGRCEFVLARQLAGFLRLEKGARLLAIDRIHRGLSHDTLLALWASAFQFSPNGPFGLDEAAGRFYDKPAVKLDWNEAALLALAAKQLDDAMECTNVPKLTAQRAGLLANVSAELPTEQGAAEAPRIEAAEQAPLPCRRPSMLKLK
jgi:hypothetical protein